jgi:hypothetical protein
LKTSQSGSTSFVRDLLALGKLALMIALKTNPSFSKPLTLAGGFGRIKNKCSDFAPDF